MLTNKKNFFKIIFQKLLVVQGCIKNNFVGNLVTFNLHKKYFVRKNNQIKDAYEKNTKYHFILEMIKSTLKNNSITKVLIGP